MSIFCYFFFQSEKFIQQQMPSPIISVKRLESVQFPEVSYVNKLHVERLSSLLN